MSVSRRTFVKALGAGGVGAAAVSWVCARGHEALAGARPGPLRSLSAVTTAPAASSIRLDSNENPHGPGPAAVEAIRGALGEASRYPDRPELDLREAVARWHGLHVENILLGCGSTEILRMAVGEFTSASRSLVTAQPTFEDPGWFARRIGSPVEAVPVDGSLRLDLAGMASRAPGAGLVYLCNPNNPTATFQGAAAVREFASKVLKEAPSATILVDEAYFEYVEDRLYATAIPLAMESPRVIVSRTFSKAHGLAGLRAGYAVGDPATIKRMERHKLPSGVNLLGAAAASASLGQPDHIAGQRKLNHEAKEFTRRFFESEGYQVVPSETNFMMVDVRRPAAEFRAACRKHDVLVGRPFPPLESHARISIGTMDEMRRAVEVFRRALGAPEGGAPR